MKFGEKLKEFLAVIGILLVFIVSIGFSLLSSIGGFWFMVEKIFG